MVNIIIIGGNSSNLETDCLSTCEYSNGIFNEFRFNKNLFPDISESRRSPSVFAINSTILVMGGCVKRGTHLNSICYLKKSKRIYAQWIKPSVLFLKSFSCAAFCQFRDNTMFVAGGFDGLECLNEVSLVKYNIENDHVSITSLEKLPVRLKNAVAVAIDEKTSKNVKKVFLIGGWDGKQTLKTIFEYSFYKNKAKCELKSVMPIALEGHTITKVASPNYDALICGGYDGVSVVSSIYKFQYESASVVLCKEERLLLPRENHVSFSVYENGKQFFVVCGGWDGFNALNNCEVFEIQENTSILKRRNDHKLKLVVPRNRPASVVMIDSS